MFYVVRLLILPVLISQPAQAETPYQNLGHPRLYFTSTELKSLRAARTEGIHARIWGNLAESAEWCLSKPLRTEWIAPVTPDPIYENLYDRFYAMMHDMAISEHLSFAYAYSGERQYRKGARDWLLSCARIWSHESQGKPDASKAYAVMRLVKALALGYDVLYNDLTSQQRSEVQHIMVSIGKRYYKDYWTSTSVGKPGFNHHHASVEAGGFGLLALSLLGEVPEAEDWLNLIIHKHTSYLLPHGLTLDGLSLDGSSHYWASTMQSRYYFLDPLRRITGRDLFREYSDAMSGRILLASVTAPRQAGQNNSDESVMFCPSYSQLDYMAPVLLFLARETRRPVYQHLALWDPNLGSIHRTRGLTPTRREQLLFETGGFAYAWYDPSVSTTPQEDLLLSYHFPVMKEAYARTSYQPDGIVVGAKGGSVQISAGGQSVFNIYGMVTGKDILPMLSDDGNTAVITWRSASGKSASRVRLERPDTVTLTCTGDRSWRCLGNPSFSHGKIIWTDGTVLECTSGRIVSLDLKGAPEPDIRVGNGKLTLLNESPFTNPLISAKSENGILELQITIPGKTDNTQ